MLSVVVTAPYLQPLLDFGQNYGLMVVGAMLVLAALQGRKFGPFALVSLVIGLGIVIAGAAHHFPGWG